MRLKMGENSLFALLLRKPWWVSILIAAGAALAMSALLPAPFAKAGMSTGLPFLVIGIIAAARQFREPGAAQVAQTVELVGAMSWRDFSAAVEQAFQRDGYAVQRCTGAADFEISKDDRVSLVSCKRWKAANTGIEPLRELQTAIEVRGAQEAIHVGIGPLTDNARAFAAEKNIRVIQSAGLAQLLRGMRPAQQR